MIDDWSLGCLCDLKPEYGTTNKFFHGAFIIESKMKIENLKYAISGDKINISYDSDNGHVVSDLDKKEFQSRVDSMGWRKWDMELVQSGKVTGRTYGLMSWDEYYDFLTALDVELFILTFENIGRRNSQDRNGNNPR